MTTPPTLDPLAELARSLALAQLRALHDELVVARRAADGARATVPTVTHAWLGPASDSLTRAAAVQRADIDTICGQLDAAIAILRAELA